MPFGVRHLYHCVLWCTMCSDSVYCDVQCLNHSVLWCIMYHSFYTHNVCITVSSDVRVLYIYITMSSDVLFSIYHSVSLMYDVSITVCNVCITLSAMLNVSQLPCHWAHIAISMFPTCRISLLCTLYCIYPSNAWSTFLSPIFVIFGYVICSRKLNTLYFAENF